MKKTVKKTLNIILDIFIIFILLISILIVTLSLTTNSSGVPNIFGIAPLSVQSDSMEPEFSKGDLIFSKVSTDVSDSFKVGDVVSFYDNIDGMKEINTHRIVKIESDSDTGVDYIYTKGDNAPDVDDAKKTNAEILATYTGTKIGGLGNVLSFLRTQLGFFLCILLPMILFFVYEAIRVIMNIIAYNKAKAIEQAEEAVANSDLTEEQKQRAIEEYLAQQKQKAEEQKQDSDPGVQTPAAEEAGVPDDTAGAAESSDEAQTADSEK